jgi:Uma2 family endonuclease
MTFTVRDLEKFRSQLSPEYEDYKIPELFPGWELPITELWPPVFD